MTTYTMREKILLAIIGGLLIGLFMRDAAEAQNPGLLFGRDGTSGANSVIQTNGSNAIKVTGK